MISSHRFSLTQTQPGEKLSIFLDFLAPKLPAPIEEDLRKRPLLPNRTLTTICRNVNLLLRGLSRQARHKADQVTPVVKALVVDWLIVP